MRHEKAVPIWASKIPLQPDEPGHPGRRFGNCQGVPGWERLTETRKTKAKSKKRRNYWRTTEGKRMKAFMRSTLNFHPHDANPVYGKKGRWQPIKTKRGMAHDVGSTRDGDCHPRFQREHGLTPQDKSYGKSIDHEGTAQMNARHAEFLERYS